MITYAYICVYIYIYICILIMQMPCSLQFVFPPPARINVQNLEPILEAFMWFSLAQIPGAAAD